MDQSRINGENENGSVSAQVHNRTEIWPEIYFEQDGDRRRFHRRSSWFQGNVRECWPVSVTSFSQMLCGSQWRRHRGSSCQFSISSVTKPWCCSFFCSRSPFSLHYQTQQDQVRPFLWKVLLPLENQLVINKPLQQWWTQCMPRRAPQQTVNFTIIFLYYRQSLLEESTY